ncbi:MAG TPA: MMPL family transporter [Solirubrobacterales bacterium]|nr:MMPL family transporter [Solirubrobacterales bacterium]
MWRPRVTLGLALVATVALGVLGIGVEGKLRPTSIDVPGTESARARALLKEHFGDSAPFVILLRGPAAALDRQGPRLVRALRARPGVTTLSPWDRGSLARLRPSPRKALILADFHVDAETAVRHTVPHLNELLERRIRPPVSATQTGFATLSRAIQDESVSSTHTAELIAVPILLLVLLLVFRSPVAAAIPLLFGAAAVLASRGLLSLAASRLAIDGFALTVATMMGLALGVDYALLMVSRFREELAAAVPAGQAALRTRRTAGRTTAFAGSTLVLAMAVTLWIMPGNLFLSLAGTAILVTLISVAIAFLVAPPLLYVLGPNVNRWQLGRIDGGRWLMPVVSGALTRPRLVAAAIGAVLLFLALPALGLKTGPPSATQLPESNNAREDAEAIDEAIGAGWDAPFILVAASGRGPITDESRLAALRREQRRIAADRGVQAVVGPGQIERRVSPLREGGNELLAEEGPASPAKLTRLGRRLGRAAGGVGQLRRGVSQAAAGAGLIATGSGRAGEGAAKISEGLAEAGSGAGEAVEALDRLDRGSGKLANGQAQVARGSELLDSELSGLLPLIGRGGVALARRLRDKLGAAAARDPSLADELEEARILVHELSGAHRKAEHAYKTSKRLHEGQVKLAGGGAELHAGAHRLARKAQGLPAGLAELEGGADQLAAGLTRLTGGADELSRHLADGFHRSRPLQGGLTRASVRVTASGSHLSRRVTTLRRSSPQIFNSGSFVLSALEGAPRAQRERAGQVVDLTHGGQGSQMLIIPRYTFNTPGSRALYGRLRRDGDALAASSGLRTGVTGGPAQLVDYSDAVNSRVPLVILAITLITFLVLVLVLRAIPLAAIAVALNLLTVAVAFGVLTLLFDVPAGWPLGGHTYVDAIGAAGIFGIIFGLSIDYAVFLLSRMRESYEAGASNEEAIGFGLQRTARVITGAAAIMLAVFVAFAGAPIATVSQLGTGLAVAVLLDATVVRIVLLPALMLLIGERVWWLPPALARVLPAVGLHGEPASRPVEQS